MGPETLDTILNDIWLQNHKVLNNFAKKCTNRQMMQNTENTFFKNLHDKFDLYFWLSEELHLYRVSELLNLILFLLLYNNLKRSDSLEEDNLWGFGMLLIKFEVQLHESWRFEVEIVNKKTVGCFGWSQRVV